MIVGHIMGLPVEETVLQFAPAGAATVTMAAFLGRAKLARVLGRVRRRRLA
jgi:hypothetical protein